MTAASLDAFCRTKLDALDAKALLRTPTLTSRRDGVWVERDGRRLLSFSCNDYLNLTHDARVKFAAAAAIDEYGAGAGASKLVTGNHPLLERLEAKLAAIKGTDGALVFGSGYLTNVGITPMLAGPGDLVVLDGLAHACLWAGAKLSGAKVMSFAHNDAGALRDILRTHRTAARHALVLTEGVFSMDGDIAPLDEIAPVCAAFDAWLLTDDAHALGVIGGGRGSAAMFPDARTPLQMGTLSKAVASYGGYLCASRSVIDLAFTRARTHVYSTGLPPAAAAAALAAIEIIEREPERAERAVARAALFAEIVGVPATGTAIVPVILGDAERALGAQRALEQQGFLAVAIRPPTVAPGTARLRFAFTAAHPPEEVERAAKAVRALL
jgi:8-amino-7-oxononanoate synthase